MEQSISDIPHTREGSRHKCCDSAKPSSQQRCCTETSRTHPDCSEPSSLHRSARESSGFDTAGSFVSQQPPSPSNHNSLPWLLQCGAGQVMPLPTTESWTFALGHSCPSAPYSLGWDGLRTSVGSGI